MILEVFFLLRFTSLPVNKEKVKEEEGKEWRDVVR
jgi:hypothetical protein